MVKIRYSGGGGLHDLRYLKLDGSNANQDIDIGNYNFTIGGDITVGGIVVAGGGLVFGEIDAAPDTIAGFGQLYVLESGGGNDAYTTLLLHCDGVGGAQVFVDSSANGFAVDDNGNVYTDTTERKFGSASANFDGNGDFLRVLDDGDLDFGAGDFTIDFWVRLNSIQRSGTNAAIRNTFICKSGWSEPSAWTFSYSGAPLDATDKVRFWNNEVQVVASAADALITNQWYHIAVSRRGITVYLFIDGVLVDTGVSATNYFNATSLYIGVDGFLQAADRDLDGRMDEIRVTKGVARWINTFDVPTAAYGIGGLYYRHSDGTITGLA